MIGSWACLSLIFFLGFFPRKSILSKVKFCIPDMTTHNRNIRQLFGFTLRGHPYVIRSEWASLPYKRGFFLLCGPVPWIAFPLNSFSFCGGVGQQCIVNIHYMCAANFNFFAKLQNPKRVAYTLAHTLSIPYTEYTLSGSPWGPRVGSECTTFIVLNEHSHPLRLHYVCNVINNQQKTCAAKTIKNLPILLKIPAATDARNSPCHWPCGFLF